MERCERFMYTDVIHFNTRGDTFACNTEMQTSGDTIEKGDSY